MGVGGSPRAGPRSTKQLRVGARGRGSWLQSGGWAGGSCPSSKGHHGPWASRRAVCQLEQSLGSGQVPLPQWPWVPTRVLGWVPPCPGHKRVALPGLELGDSRGPEPVGPLWSGGAVPNVVAEARAIGRSWPGGCPPLTERRGARRVGGGRAHTRPPALPVGTCSAQRGQTRCHVGAV